MSVPPPNHWLFQLANACLLISYATSNYLLLRLLLAFASLCLLLWGAFLLGVSVDTIVWNSIFFLVNFYYTLKLILATLPIKFDADREAVYDMLFSKTKAGGLSRADFKQLSDPSMCFIRTAKAGTVIAQMGNTSQNLTLLLKGRVNVIRYLHTNHSSPRTNRNDALSYNRAGGGAASIVKSTNKAIGAGTGIELSSSISPSVVGGDMKPELCIVIGEYCFLDSPEFVSRNTERGSVFEVDMVAEENVTYFIWPYQNLRKLFSMNPALQQAINSVVMIDLARKVLEGGSDSWVVDNVKKRTKNQTDALFQLDSSGSASKNDTEKELVVNALHDTKQNGKLLTDSWHQSHQVASISSANDHDQDLPPPQNTNQTNE